MVPQRPRPPQRSNWATCMSCRKKGWITRKQAKEALKRYYPGQFQEMQVYRCHEGPLFHHGHRIPERFRDSDLSSCRHCHREIKRVAGYEWVHSEDDHAECGLKDLTDGVLMATPFWKVITD